MTADNTANNVEPEKNPEIDLRLLEMEYNYLVQSSFHTDNLRDRFIQYYLILVSVTVTILVGVLQIGELEINPLIFTFAAFILFLIGAMLVPIFVRLRRVVWECLVGMALIKEYCKKHAVYPQDLSQALMWDRATVPKDEVWYSASSLLVLMMILLNSVMLGGAVFLWVGLLAAIVIWLVSCGLQWIFYRRRIVREKTNAGLAANLAEKLEYFELIS